MVILLLAMFSISLAKAQEEKEDKKVMKIKIVSDEGGNIKIDTTITLDEGFDVDWSAIIEDEELLKKLEDIDIDLKVDGGANIYMVKTPGTQKQAYFYTVETDDKGEVKLKVSQESGGDALHEVFVQEIEGDSTISIVLKTEGCIKSTGHEEVMIWQSDDGGEKKEYKIVLAKPNLIHVDNLEGDSLVTYKITLGEDGEKNVAVWYSQDDEAISSDVFIEKIQGDSCKVIIMSSGDEEDLKIVKKKEVIIITDDADKKGKDKGKKNKKNKKK
jgi:hypothetical protein